MRVLLLNLGTVKTKDRAVSGYQGNAHVLQCEELRMLGTVFESCIE